MIIFLSHAEPDVRDAMYPYVDLGGTEKPIQMSNYEKNPSLMKGKGPLTWTAEPLTDSFWYPFDSYKLYVNPQILVRIPVTDVDEYFKGGADKMSLEFAGANLVADLTAKEYDDPKLKEIGDPFEINLYRPFLGAGVHGFRDWADGVWTGLSLLFQRHRRLGRRPAWIFCGRVVQVCDLADGR